MFKPVPVEISNSNDFPIESHPFRVGIPCPEGTIFNPEHLRLRSKSMFQPLHVTCLANWPDGSMKWILLDFQASVGAREQSFFQLVTDEAENNHPDDTPETVEIVFINDLGDQYHINTGPAQFVVSKYRLVLFDQVISDNKEQLSDSPGGVQLIDEQGDPATSIVTAVKLSDTENTLRKTINIDGFFQNTREQRLADFSLKQTFYAGCSTVKCEFTLTNTKAAIHPGGLWDLGDKGSFFFKELSLEVQLAPSDDLYQSSIRFSTGTDWRLADSGRLKLEQNSSGGKNWLSKNHMNFRGKVPLAFKGFRYFEQGIQVASGDRATPTFHLTSAGTGVTAHIIDFWENFPKAISAEQATLSLNLFPRYDSECYELQGGERKKHSFYLDFSNNRTSLDSYIDEAIPRIPLAYYCETRVIPWLPGFHEDSGIQQLIDSGIEGENNFFDKREAIDEFGWRNFGEIFADHEGLEYKGSEELISHYNNQYDPLYGFIKQYLISGDSRWYELLSDLAQHIVDIDIYHTAEDRDEYNGGLFWHTHHYLTAFTCTHRTFSCKHAADFLYGQIGGGPGAEHCYTTGLSYYYFMTGDGVYKDAALQLVDWVSRVLEGSGAVVERIFQFKSKELPVLKRLIAGETVQRYRYPFTRGTGNYITSLIDAYNLTGERQYLLNVERVIQQSIHPLDDIVLRNLDDTESSWSYLIYLQAICKYLDLKTSLQQVDEACLYARDSLLHYVEWMVENEAPFLQHQEKLEYPNHTWTAQDLRKANLFYIASLYSDDKKTRYLEAANSYFRLVEQTLKNEETRYYSRILILLMQNDIHQSGLDYDAARPIREAPGLKLDTPAPLYSFSGILKGFIMDVGRRLTKLSFKNERRWLSCRMK